MKEKLIIFFKGMILGSAMIIPGVSGGTLAISLGLYEKMINTISHFFKDLKNNLLFIINLGLGILASLVLGALILNYTFEHAPIPTILFFIGLLIGSIPSLMKKVNLKNTLKISNIFYFLLGISLVLGVYLLKGNSNVSFSNTFNFIQTIKLVLVGIIAAATLVVPGISGSFMLMVLGYYEPILKTITELVKMSNIANNLIVLIPFGIGVLIGVITITKIIEYLLRNHETKTYYAIIGFLVASIIEIFVSLFNYTTNVIQIIISIILFILGLLLTLKVFKNE